MSKEKFLRYFKKKESTSEDNEDHGVIILNEDITIINVVTSVTKDITNAELSFASFSVSFTRNHWLNTERSIEFFDENIFPYLKKVEKEKRFPEQ